MSHPVLSCLQESEGAGQGDHHHYCVAVHVDVRLGSLDVGGCGPALVFLVAQTVGSKLIDV